MTNAANQAQVKNAEKRQKARERQKRNDLLAVLESGAGRRYIWRQLCDAGVFRDIPTAGSVQDICGAIGRRSLGLKMLSEIPPDSYHKMQVEAATEKETREQVQDAENHEGKKDD